jgi:hypothetical protein
MKECELVRNFQSFERQLKNFGYSISVISNGFFIHNKGGTIVAECQTVDGLRAATQMIESLDPNAGLKKE